MGRVPRICDFTGEICSNCGDCYMDELIEDNHKNSLEDYLDIFGSGQSYGENSFEQ